MVVRDNIEQKNNVEIIQTLVVSVRHLGNFYVPLLLTYLTYLKDVSCSPDTYSIAKPFRV